MIGLAEFGPNSVGFIRPFDSAQGRLSSELALSLPKDERND